MGLGLRYFLFEEDGTLRHVAQRVIEGLAGGMDRLPQYAGQSLPSNDRLFQPTPDIHILGSAPHEEPRPELPKALFSGSA